MAGGAARGDMREWFAPDRTAPVFKGFDDWYGADVALATGWETVYPVLRLPGCRARAYLVHDHEPEFFADVGRVRCGPSDTYRQGLLRASPASPWLRDLVARALRRARQLVRASASTTTSTARAPVAAARATR